MHTNQVKAIRESSFLLGLEVAKKLSHIGPDALEDFINMLQSDGTEVAFNNIECIQAPYKDSDTYKYNTWAMVRTFMEAGLMVNR